MEKSKDPWKNNRLSYCSLVLSHWYNLLKTLTVEIFVILQLILRVFHREQNTVDIYVVKFVDNGYL